MDYLKARFEKELKNKLLHKTSGHMTEEVLLLKSFKYFDTEQSGVCDLDLFIQTLAKIGLYGFSDEEFAKLFKEYSQGDEYLDYKDFIGVVFNNLSLMKKSYKPEKDVKMEEGEEDQGEEEENEQPPQEQEKPKIEKGEEKAPQVEEGEEEEEDPIERILLRLRNKMSKAGIENLISIENGFRTLDTENVQAIDLITFKKACDQFNFGLEGEEIKMLFDAMEKDEQGRINYDEFIRILRNELAAKRKDLVDNVFKAISGDGRDSMSLEELCEIYNPKGSLEYLYQKLSEEEAMKIFIKTLKNNHIYLNGEDEADKEIDLEEFEDYYESVSLMIPDDEIFKEVLLKTWRLVKDEPPEEKIPPQEQKEEEEIPPKEEEQEEKAEPVKEEEKPREGPKEVPKAVFEMEPKKVEPPKTQAEKEKEFRRNLLDEQNLDAFRNLIGSRGIKEVMKFVNQLRQYDRKNNKELPYADFSEVIYNCNLNMNDDDIRDLFNDFVKPNTKTLNYGEFLSALVGELNQRRNNIVVEAFKRLDMEKCEVINLSDVKTFFNSKNSPLVREGLMSEEEFYNSFMETFQTHHNIFRSAKIKKVNFEEFIDYYKYVSITIEDDYLFEDMVISSWKLTKSVIAHAGPKDNVKSLIGAPELEVPNENEINQNVSLVGTNKRAKKYFPAKSQGVPYGIDDKATDYSNLLHPKGDLNGIKLNKNDNPLQAFRKKIILRGVRGIMSLRRTFVLYDENKNNKLNLEEFHKYIEDYRMGLSDEEEKKLFKLFDLNNSGDIDYNELIKGIVGEMNSYRRSIVEKVFDKLDKDKTGNVSYDVIRNGYNPAKHPEVLNGSRNDEEMLSRFLDMFEYHFNLLNDDKEKEFANLNEFIAFYNYISMFIEDDKYFENLMSRVWELSNANFAKGFRSFKKKNL